MNYLIEALLVGIYCLIIKFFINNININNIFILLFIIGFIKHFFGNILQIHYWYCKKYNNNYKSIINYKLFIDSIMEGILFIIVDTILILFMINKIFYVFLIIQI